MAVIPKSFTIWELIIFLYWRALLEDLLCLLWSVVHFALFSLLLFLLLALFSSDPLPYLLIWLLITVWSLFAILSHSFINTVFGTHCMASALTGHYLRVLVKAMEPFIFICDRSDRRLQWLHCRTSSHSYKLLPLSRSQLWIYWIPLYWLVT